MPTKFVSKTISVIEECKAITKEVHLTIVLVVDTSGSMAGAKIRSVAECVEDLLSKRKADDRLYFLAFNDAPGEMYDLTEEKDMSLKLKAQGQTALYDAMLHALECLKSEKDAVALGQIQFIVLTDGEDNSSKNSFSAVKKAFLEPGLANFHLSVIGIGEYDRKLKKFQEEGKRHIKFFEARDSADAIKEQFRLVTLFIQKTRISQRVDIEHVSMKPSSKLTSFGSGSTMKMLGTGTISTKKKVDACPFKFHCSFGVACKSKHSAAEKAFFSEVTEQEKRKSCKSTECKRRTECPKWETCWFSHHPVDSFCKKCKNWGHLKASCGK